MKSKGYITALKWSRHKQLLFIIANYNNLDFKIIEEDKGWLMSTIYYQVEGEPEDIKDFNRSVQKAIKEYNKNFNH